MMFFILFSARLKKTWDETMYQESIQFSSSAIKQAAKRKSLMYKSLETFSLYTKCLDLSFLSVEEILASIVYISFFPLNSTADAKIPLDKLQTMGHKGSTTGNFSAESCFSLWCTLWAASPASILAAHKHHRICIAERGERGWLDAQLYFPKLKHDRLGECWWVNRFYSESEEWNVKIPEAAPSACSG